MNLDPSTTKYMIRARVRADGVIEKPDVVGAVFGQTEGLLGTELDMRDLQKSARIGRIEVEIDAKKGKSEGTILVPSSLDKVETAIIAAALETIDRVGPCKAKIEVDKIEDVRANRRDSIVSRAKELLHGMMEDESSDSSQFTDEVRSAVQVAEITQWGPDRLWAGPGVATSDDVILVEGRNDVVNLLRCGIRNALSVEGTNVPQSVIDICKERVTTVFIDGDRGGELIARELFGVAEVDFVARAPQTREVEELPHKLVMKALNNKMPADQFADTYGIPYKGRRGGPKQPRGREPQREERPRAEVREERGRGERARGGRGREPRGEMREERGRGEMREPRGPPREPRGEVREERGPPREPRGEVREERGPPREPRGEFREERGPPREPRGEFREERGPREGGRPERRDERGGRGGGRDRGEDRAERMPRQLPPALIAYRDILGSVSGSLKAVLLDKEGKELARDIAVRDLADTLRNSKDEVAAVVFDGVITQRLLDIATDRKIETVVGVKVGNVTKKPETVQVVTKSELE